MDAPQKKAPMLFRALSDPTRLELLKRLKGGEKCVCELTDVMQTGQSRLSFHLKVLKDAGLVSDRRDGRWKYYSMNRDGLNDLKGAVGELDGGTNSTTSVSSVHY
ncbi:MAG: transcriptional regulator [Nitrospira sp. WS238]|nr:transcriptional regulator [Nitrospira sp. WS238]